MISFRKVANNGPISQSPAPSPERDEALMALRAGRLAEAAEVCERGIARTSSHGEDAECWRLRIILSQCVCERGDFADAVQILESVPVSDAISAETRARVLSQKAFCLSRGGDFALAKALLDEAVTLASGGPSALQAEIEMNRCTLFFYLAKYDQVENCALVALHLGEEQKLPILEANGCSGIGKSYMYRDNHAEAIPWYERALKIFEREGATFHADAMRSELGCCHLALGDYDKASSYFAQALKTCRESGALSRLHINLANMGCVHLAGREFAPAISYFQEALEIARRLGDAISVSKWSQNLALTYTKMGNPVIAKGYQLEAERFKEQVALARAAAK